MLHSKVLFNQTVILIVKPLLALTIGAGAVALTLLAGCGQPGPLIMPKQPVKANGAKQVPPVPAMPVPDALPTTVTPSSY
jgi:predicted small lipoprotein YifL